MDRTRWRAEALLAVLFGIVITVGGGGALWFFSAVPIHPDPAAVPSTAGAHVERYSHAIEEGRRLARALVLNENLPGLSVAVAADGEIVPRASAGPTSSVASRSRRGQGSVSAPPRNR